MIHIMKICVCIDPLQLLTALDSKLKSCLNELWLSQVHFKSPKEILPFGKHINFAIGVSHLLIEQVTFCTMVHALKNLFLFVDLLIGFFLVDVALEMIFVVRLPRLRTHVTEVLTTSASYEVTPMGSFYCLFAKRTYFSILRYPLHISLFLNHPRHPPFFLFTETGMVVIALT